MHFTLVKALKEHKTAMKNLMQFYIYDFSEYLEYDVEADGLFAPYPDLEDYWEGANNKFPYIIKSDDKYIGFVLVKFIESEVLNYFSIAEFFILRKYRLQGVGKAIAIRIFNLHKGKWEVYQKAHNKPALIFWNRVIKDYTKGHFKESFEEGKQIQNFES
jgi:predicted acetyltransferase